MQSICKVPVDMVSEMFTVANTPVDLIDRMTRSAKEFMVELSATVDVGINSTAILGISFDSLFIALELRA